MSNIDSIEAILARCNEVSRLTGSIGASLAHWAAYSVLYHDAMVSQSNNADARERLEQRAETMKEVLAWASGYAHPDFLPDGHDVAKRFAERTVETGQTDEEAIQEHASLFMMTYEQAKASIEAGLAQQAEERAALQQAIAAQQTGYAMMLKRCLASEVGDDFEVNDHIARVIVDRIAHKLDQAAQRKEAQGRATVRQRRKRQLGAEYQLICGIVEQADNLFERLEQAIENGRTTGVDHPANESNDANVEYTEVD